MDMIEKDSLTLPKEEIFSNKHIFDRYIGEEVAADSQRRCKWGSLAPVSSLMEEKGP